MVTDNLNELYIDGGSFFYCSVCKKRHRLDNCPFKDLCMFCKERKATLNWEDSLSISRGFTELNCCEYCRITKQLEHARERAESIPTLEDELEQFIWTENHFGKK